MSLQKPLYTGVASNEGTGVASNEGTGVASNEGTGVASNEGSETAKDSYMQDMEEEDPFNEPLPPFPQPAYEKPRKQRITKAQSNSFKEWLLRLPDEQKKLSAAKLAKLYEETNGLTVSRMFVCNVKRNLRDRM